MLYRSKVKNSFSLVLLLPACLPACLPALRTLKGDGEGLVERDCWGEDISNKQTMMRKWLIEKKLPGNVCVRA